MQYEVERSDSESPDPSLAQMTRKATFHSIKESKGFFLMVEG